MKKRIENGSKRWLCLLLVILLTFSGLPGIGSMPIAFANGGDFDSGLGTVEDPYIITTPEHLNNVRNYPGKYFELGRDIDLTAYIGTAEAQGVGWNAGAGWVPIGTDATKFTGNFDGKGYDITGLFINGVQNDVGLFGVAENATIKNLKVIGNIRAGNDTNSGNSVGGVVGRFITNQNNVAIGIFNVEFNGNVNGWGSVGGIIGELSLAAGTVSIENNKNFGNINLRHSYGGGIIGSVGENSNTNTLNIKNNTNTGDVNLSGEDSWGQAGAGIVGYLVMWAQNSVCAIENNTNSANITVSRRNGGGIVGYCYFDQNYIVTIKNNINSGEIVTTREDYSGGIIGILDAYGTSDIDFWGNVNHGEVVGRDYSGGIIGGIAGYLKPSSTIAVSNNFNIGAITASRNYAGGLLGRANIGAAKSLTVEKSYSIGTVSGVNNAGGAIGNITTVGGFTLTISNLFYDSQLSGQSDNDGKGVPKTTAQMKRQATFTGWDFDAVWSIVDTDTHWSYPYLRWLKLAAVDAPGYAIKLSNNAGLTSVATQSDGSPAGGNGSASGTPIIWGIIVPNAKSNLGITDIIVADNGTKSLHTNNNFSDGAITGETTVALIAGGAATVYLKVTSQDSSTIKYYAVTIIRAASSGGSSEDNRTPVTPPQSNAAVIVIVNGQEQNAGIETKTTEEGKSIVTVGVDNKVIEGKIDEAIKSNTTGIGNLLQVPVADTQSDVVKVELTGDIVKKLEDNHFDVSVKRDNIEYIIPAEEFTIGKVADNFGILEKDLFEIKIEMKITKLEEAVVAKYNEVAKANGAELVFPPVEFEITAKTTKIDGTTEDVAISKFSSYVARIMEIPAGLDPSKITTGIVFNPDGTYSHVPTEMFQKDGKWYAKLNSLTNSNYSVVWNPVAVKSVESHWSKDAVNDMASRLVIFNPETFDPNKAITRADFAEYIVRALGLYREGSKHENMFKDVSATGDRTLAILIANEYGIVTGYPDGTFRPDQQITREEAMAMCQRAMKVTKLAGVDQNRYQSYTDYKQVGSWATTYVKEVLSAHVFIGTTATTISPKANLNHAEAAQAIKNLLAESKLINK